MDLSFSNEELQFQQQVREFLAENLTQEIVEATANNSSVFLEKELALKWQAILVKQGWAVPQWPTEHGGTDWSPTQKYIFSRECYLAGAPMLIPLGLLMLAPVIMAFGSDEQKANYLPKILSGESYWCQGYSEPGAGSDLASLKLKAQGDGENYIVNGSKTFITNGVISDYLIVAAKTAPELGNKGISIFVLDRETKGISATKLDKLGWRASDTGEIAFDNVSIPLSNLMGEENKGFPYIMQHFALERLIMAITL